MVPSPRLSAENRKQAIIAATIPLFAQHGYEVTTREIAAAAGVSEALLYRHFPSKADIFKAIQATCIEHAAEPVGHLNRMPDDTGSLVVCVYVLMSKVQDCGRMGAVNHDDMRRLITLSLLGDGELAAQFMHHTSDVWVDKIRRCIASAREAGDLINSCEDAELAVWLAHHISVTIGLYALPDRKPIIDYPGDKSKLLDRSVLFCLRGMGLTDEAIKAHFRPETLALLLEQQG